mmetsp:Transcript_22193/g.59865  ORF Transcript_22193/g.59865 Transcript_22193/m.59865 type:complete len:327 (-) Transcript_22193:214-1194(-)
MTRTAPFLCQAEQTLEVLSMASEINVRLDDTLKAMFSLTVADHRPAAEQAARPQTVADLISRYPMPDFISEWFDRPSPVVVRCQVTSSGSIAWIANPAMVQLLNADGADKLIQGSSILNHDFFLDDDWLETFPRTEERQAVLSVMFDLKTSLVNNSLGESPGCTPRARHVWNDVPIPVNVRFGKSLRGPFRASIRVVARNGMDEVWDCFALTPLVMIPLGAPAGPLAVNAMEHVNSDCSPQPSPSNTHSTADVDFVYTEGGPQTELNIGSHSPSLTGDEPLGTTQLELPGLHSDPSAPGCDLDQADLDFFVDNVPIDQLLALVAEE